MQRAIKIKECPLDSIEGLMTVPTPKGQRPHYDFKAMREYAKAKGKKVAELSDKEHDKFILYWR
ncbi:MAG: hypothetical protein FWB72_00565 [Firmicutes bacterium]|nr:hypothetical protein [Bacillota bacterium]